MRNQIDFRKVDLEDSIQNFQTRIFLKIFKSRIEIFTRPDDEKFLKF